MNGIWRFEILPPWKCLFLLYTKAGCSHGMYSRGEFDRYWFCIPFLIGVEAVNYRGDFALMQIQEENEKRIQKQAQQGE